MADMHALAPSPEQTNTAPAETEKPYVYVKRISMTPQDWAEVSNNPRQRNTEDHARRAKHLLAYSPEHPIVKMAVLPDGRRFKLDGHTRSYLWSTGVVEAPKWVMVDVFRCRTLKDVEMLYEHYDNRLAAENARDVLAGAARKLGLEFNTTLMRQGKYGRALVSIYARAYNEWGARVSAMT